jgi:very-short-patch-repair endonuclease
MTQIFNRHEAKASRQRLRHQLPDAERIVWSRLKNGQVGGFRFRRQYSIGSYIVDFYCPRAKLIVEIDGPTHFTDAAEAYDAVREEYFRSLGLRIVRFTNDQVRRNLNGVWAKLINVLRAASSS